MKRFEFLVFIIVLYASSGWSQEILSNGSFEGSIAKLDEVPPEWYLCNKYSTPDIQPLNSKKRASNGDFFIGLVARDGGDDSSDKSYSKEALGHAITPLTPGHRYSITMDLAYDSKLRPDWAPKLYPGRLNIYLSNGECANSHAQWQSPLIDHDNWRKYEFIYSAKCDDQYIIIEATHGNENDRLQCYIMVDNMLIRELDNAGYKDTLDCLNYDPSQDPSATGASYSSCSIYIPNAFSPNFDGINDEFKVNPDCFLLDFSLFIYNRWGAQIFSSHNPEIGWDGRSKNGIAEEGAYIYQMRYSYYDETGKKQIKTQADLIHVIR